MFLCEKCHTKQGWCTKSAILHSQSFGRCERCGAVAGCLDCHRYDFRVPPANAEDSSRDTGDSSSKRHEPGKPPEDKHSPRPWRHYGPTTLLILDANGRGIVGTHVLDDSMDEAEANLRLILKRVNEGEGLEGKIGFWKAGYEKASDKAQSLQDELDETKTKLADLEGEKRVLEVKLHGQEKLHEYCPECGKRGYHTVFCITHPPGGRK